MGGSLVDGGASNRRPSAAEGRSPVELGQFSQFGTNHFHAKKEFFSFELWNRLVAPMWRFDELRSRSAPPPPKSRIEERGALPRLRTGQRFDLWVWVFRFPLVRQRDVRKTHTFFREPGEGGKGRVSAHLRSKCVGRAFTSVFLGSVCLSVTCCGTGRFSL